MFAAQVGIVGHLQIGDNVKIGGQSGIMKNVKDGEILQGSSAMPYKDFWKSYAVFMKLPEVWRQVNQLEREIKNINENK
jgi:UDP-3-O-[3-hydroxymyristoyl] glucosamine N-acyltransferase